MNKPPMRRLWSVARPGWTIAPGATAESAGRMVKVGALSVPETFECIVRELHPEGPEHTEFLAVLMYEVEEGDAELRMVYAGRGEVDQALSRLRQEMDLTEWKRLAVAYMAAEQAQVDLAALDPRFATTADPVGEVSRAAHQTPMRRRRDRITDALLREVAQVYLEAEEAGHPPRKAVAERFHKDLSTVSKWIARARAAGHLPAWGHVQRSEP